MNHLFLDFCLGEGKVGGGESGEGEGSGGYFLLG